MIIKILQSSHTFEAVKYNERKVSEGVAELLEVKNFQHLQELGMLEAKAIQNTLMEYSAKNSRIWNTQFHATISAKNDECSFDELMEAAHQYLDEMGYGHEKQPILIYAHHDTCNNHIHIISSRVDPMGRKIKDSFEHVRTQTTLEKINHVDRQDRLQSSISKAFQYNFENLSQFKAIVEASGYTTFEEDNNLLIKRSGVIQMQLAIADLDKMYKKNYLGDNRRKQIKAILKKYRDITANKEELSTMMKEKFGLQLVFVGKKTNPYGYMIVDNKNKSVYKGGSILPLKELLAFRTRNERLNNMNDSIDKMLDDNAMLTTKKINAILFRQFGTYINNGWIIAGNEKIQLEEHLLKAIKRNDRYSWCQSFHPQTETEREVLCTFGKLGDKERIKLEQICPKNVQDSIFTFNKILGEHTEKDANDIFSSLREAGIAISRRNGTHYIIDLNKHVIFNAEAYKLDMSFDSTPLHKIPQGGHTFPIPASHETQNRAGNYHMPTGGNASDANRENEVGSRGDYDRIDDERTLKR